jgi:hypothetical protein
LVVAVPVATTPVVVAVVVRSQQEVYFSPVPQVTLWSLVRVVSQIPQVVQVQQVPIPRSQAQIFQL